MPVCRSGSYRKRAVHGIELVPRHPRLLAEDRTVKRIADLPENLLCIGGFVVAYIRTRKRDACQRDFVHPVSDGNVVIENTHRTRRDLVRSHYAGQIYHARVLNIARRSPASVLRGTDICQRILYSVYRKCALCYRKFRLRHGCKCVGMYYCRNLILSRVFRSDRSELCPQGSLLRIVGIENRIQLGIGCRIFCSRFFGIKAENRRSDLCTVINPVESIELYFI